MKYFIIIPIFGKLSHNLAIFFFMCPYIIKRRRSFVCPSVNQSVYTLFLEQRGLQLRNFVRDTRKDYRDLEAIFLKIDLDFLE